MPANQHSPTHMQTNTAHLTSIHQRKGDDLHVHFRDDDFLTHTVNATARQFSRAIVMPNLQPALQTVAQVNAYHARIKAALLPQHADFQPLMTLYLSPNTTLSDIQQAGNSPHIIGLKWYPTGATTNSHQGLSDITLAYPLLAEMEKQGLALLVHGEVVHEDVDIFDREAYFIDQILIPLRSKFPCLKISFEHITTKQAVEFVSSENSPYLGASITPQHLLFNRNHLLRGGIRPHYYCLPILKKHHHQQALLAAATQGHPSFYAGTDSAPHPQHAKENACGCAGCYTGLHAMELYAQAFLQANALNQLAAFISEHGANFYQLPLNQEMITLQPSTWRIPEKLTFESCEIVPLHAGHDLSYRFI